MSTKLFFLNLQILPYNLVKSSKPDKNREVVAAFNFHLVDCFNSMFIVTNLIVHKKVL